MKFCPSCGMRLVGSSPKYCGECGLPQPMDPNASRDAANRESQGLGDSRAELIASVEAGDAEASLALWRNATEAGDESEARTWLETAADMSNLEAMHELACLLDADGDRAAAQIWWQRAAEAGDPAAMRALGDVFEIADGVWFGEVPPEELEHSDSAAKAYGWYQRAAEAGDVHSMHTLAQYLLHWSRESAALGWLERAARAGHTSSMTRLGDRLERSGDTTSARNWLQLAVDDGSVEAMFILGDMLERGGEAAAAQVWWQRATETACPTKQREPGSWRSVDDCSVLGQTLAMEPKSDRSGSADAAETVDSLFEEVDLFSTALIQGGCTDSAAF